MKRNIYLHQKNEYFKIEKLSNTFAQIFERLLMMNITSINNTHDNQFGYKILVWSTKTLLN